VKSYEGQAIASGMRAESDLILNLDYIPSYPCQVCGETFKSRRLLATHPHDRKPVTQREQ
jgi:hypothetical protein